MKNRILCLILVFSFILIPVTANAEYKGECGDNITWTIDDEGTLTISGEGDMKEYGSDVYVQWRRHISDVKNVVIEDGVTSIADGSFSGHYNLKSITIPEGVTKIGAGAFSDCRNLEEIVLPDSVKSIGRYAFDDCNKFKSIVIPDGVETIEDYSFFNCTCLKSVKLPDSLKTIGRGAFQYCRDLEDITIPESVTSIGYGAFDDCESLECITIPSSVTETDIDFLDGCKALKEVNILCKPAYVGFGGCESLESIEIPDSAESVAFEGCKSLECIDIPYGVRRLGSISDCEKLKNINIPDSVTEIGLWSFTDCPGITDIILPGSIKNIYGSAFRNSDNLKTVTLGDGVERIYDFAFEFCTALESISIPKSMKQIDFAAFGDCDSLTDVYYGGSAEDWAQIEIKDDNEWLTDAVIHYNNTDMPVRIKVFLTNEEIKFDVEPRLINDRTMLPIRAIFEEMGAEVTWDEETQTATAVKGDTTVKMTIDVPQVIVNGEVREIDVAPQLINDRTLAPMRFVAEAFGAEVEWYESTQSANIVYNTLYPFESEDGLWGYKDSNGAVVVEPKYVYAEPFSEGRACVRNSNGFGKYGFINTAGKVVIPCEYYMAYDFHDGAALVSLATHTDEDRWTYIDRNGNRLFDKEFVLARSFSEGYAVVLKEGFGFPVPPEYDIPKKWSYIDKSGEFVTDMEFDEAGDFKDGSAQVVIDGEKCRIDKYFDVFHIDNNGYEPHYPIIIHW